MNNVKDTLKYKRKKIEVELKEAQEAAMQVKIWATKAEQCGVNVLNHIRDIQEMYEQLKRCGVAHGEK